jgi:4-diphosphocytidyl-2-C-methyl-D-erythritol kinase
MTIFAPAKINLSLKVYDRRPDGFHNLESLFLALNFGDTLHFEPVPVENSKITGFDIPPEKNIIFKALSLFREKTGFTGGFKIMVEKRIPIGGGLGGGSSNAASTLLALNSMAGSPLTRPELLEMAASLGSDVPFFIHEIPAAKITGRGEQIEPVPPPKDFIVLVNPGFPSDTAAAFRLLDEYRAKNPSGSDSSNDFLPVFNEKENSVYNDIISRLCENGAHFASLSGSGSTCFGMFKEKEQAEKAVRILSKNWEFAINCEANTNNSQ